MSQRELYGFDAPYVPLLMTLGASPLALGAAGALGRGDLIGALSMGASALALLLCAASFVYTTRAGKFAVWRELLDALSLRGDERALDIGCGRGAVLLLAAQRLPSGHVTGVDLWRAQDQSGNGEAAARSNAEAEGVSPRVTLRTADMRALPFEDASFDLVMSSLAVHNVSDADGRAQAMREVARVLRPGGRALIADFKHAREYAEVLRREGLSEVSVRGLGARFWYGGPWAATSAVTARKPTLPVDPRVTD